MRRILIAAGIACLMAASCAYGIAMARLELFPFHLVRAVWNSVANKQPSVDWYPGLRTRYEEMPIAADIVMFGDSHIRLMDWSELFPEAKIANRGIPGDFSSIYVVAHRTHIGGETQEGICHGGSKRSRRRARSGSSQTRL